MAIAGPGYKGSMSAFTHEHRHHPVEAVRREAHDLLEVERAGERADTPLISIAMVACVILPLAAIMMVLAIGAGWLFG
jgi:hypothetical protein